MAKLRNRRETDKPSRDYTVPPEVETPMIIECLRTGASMVILTKYLDK